MPIYKLQQRLLIQMLKTVNMYFFGRTVFNSGRCPLGRPYIYARKGAGKLNRYVDGSQTGCVSIPYIILNSFTKQSLKVVVHMASFWTVSNGRTNLSILKWFTGLTSETVYLLYHTRFQYQSSNKIEIESNTKQRLELSRQELILENPQQRKCKRDVWVCMEIRRHYLKAHVRTW